MRKIDKVTVFGVTFVGARYGFTTGCWYIKPATARAIVDKFLTGHRLPSPGYELVLNGNGSTIENCAGRFRLHLRFDRHEKIQDLGFKNWEN